MAGLLGEEDEPSFVEGTLDKGVGERVFAVVGDVDDEDVDEGCKQIADGFVGLVKDTVGAGC